MKRLYRSCEIHISDILSKKIRCVSPDLVPYSDKLSPEELKSLLLHPLGGLRLPNSDTQVS
jgi:hypothetical protein